MTETEELLYLAGESLREEFHRNYPNAPKGGWERLNHAATTGCWGDLPQAERERLVAEAMGVPVEVIQRNLSESCAAKVTSIEWSGTTYHFDPPVTEWEAFKVIAANDRIAAALWEASELEE